MHPLQKHLFDTNFQDLAGTRIEGTLALSEELINLGVMDFLNGLTPAPAATTEPAAPKAAGGSMPDPKELLKVLKIDQLAVRLVNGKLLVDVKAGI